MVKIGRKSTWLARPRISTKPHNLKENLEEISTKLILEITSFDLCQKEYIDTYL